VILLVALGSLAVALPAVLAALGGPLRGARAGLACALAAVAAWGLTAVVQLAVLAASGPSRAALAACGVALLVTGVLLLRRLGRVTAAPAPRPEPAPLPPPVAAALLVAAIVAAYVWLEHSFRYPEGDWDAWGIWNVKARFLLRGGAEGWTRLLAEVGGIQNPDYPLLLPLTVAQGWSVAGRETTLVPAAAALGSGILGVASVGFGVAVLRGRAAGALAAAVLLATPRFLSSTWSQLADVPLALFGGAAAVAAALALEAPDRRLALRRLALAGALASFGILVKNEGRLAWLALAIPLTVRWTAGTAGAGRLGAVAFWAAAAPAWAVLSVFRARFDVVSTVLFRAPPSELLARATPERLATIVAAFAREPLRLDRWGPFLLVAIAVAVAVVATPARRRSGATLGAGVALALVGFAGVYLLTPYPLALHLTLSFDRLVVGLWPTLIIAAFACLPGPSAPPTGAVVDPSAR
jgi:hypothetical protein